MALEWAEGSLCRMEEVVMSQIIMLASAEPEMRIGLPLREAVRSVLRKSV